jgi:hypothetical protein
MTSFQELETLRTRTNDEQDDGSPSTQFQYFFFAMRVIDLQQLSVKCSWKQKGQDGDSQQAATGECRRLIERLFFVL